MAVSFSQLKASGVHTVRWWVFEGSASQITRDSAGAPNGVNPAVYPDFDAALQLAQTYDLYYDFVLFSAPKDLPSGWVGNATQRQQLADALAPLFAHYSGNPHILSWEVFNEPDFDVWNGYVTQSNLAATVQTVASSVHANSHAYVTVGMGYADGLPMVTGTGLDYYQAHWYDYMSSGTYCLRCNTYAYYQSKFQLDAPLVVGELYAGTDIDALQRFQDFYTKGYAGAWPWSLFPDRTSDHMAMDLGAAKTFTSQHADTGPLVGAGAATPTPTLTASPGATATPTPTPTSTLVGAATPTPTRTGTPGTAPVVLLGDQNVEANHDSLTPGTAEAFQSTAGASGTVNKLSVYIDASSTASQVVVGLYSNGSRNSPGTLLTQATISSPVSGAWNTVAVQPAGVTANRKYWVALLGPSGAGTVQFRDMASGGRSQTSSQTNLTTLPATWTSGTNDASSPMSAYAVQGP